MGQNQFIFRGCRRITVMESDIDNATVERKDSRATIMSSNIHLHFLNKIVETK